MFDRQRLYEIVCEYSAFGDHHTGTAVDVATAEWLTGLLGDIGATVTHDPYSFERFTVAGWSLTVDGVAAPSLPVFYSAAGSFDTTDVSIVAGDGQAGSAHGLDALLATAGDAEALVVVLDSPDDVPVQCNRVPGALFGRPALIAASSWGERLRAGSARVRLEAAIEPSQSANVLATLGPADAPVVNVTTPLTGWTPAAGERGTGLAAALAIAVDLSSDHRVEFSACSGHELDHAGLRHFLGHTSPAGRPTIHLGASVAATEPGPNGPELGRTRFCLTTAGDPVRSELASIVSAANWTLLDRDPPWPGEGGTWAEAGAPVLSFLGSTPLFHTAHDTPDRATTPDALELATTTAVTAARRFCASCADEG